MPSTQGDFVATSAIPAAPTARHPNLRAPHLSGQRLQERTPAAQLHLLFLGLSPVTAAAAILLAGCGVRGFTVIDPRPATWSDATAGAFDLPDIGRARENGVRRRILAANPQAIASANPARFPTTAVAGALVIRARSTLHNDDDPRLTRVSNRLMDDHRVLDVVSLDGHPPGSTILWPPRPWFARACDECLRTAAGISPPEPLRVARHEAWPAHTALTAAVTAQHILAVATSGTSGPADGRSTGQESAESQQVTVLRPGAPLSQVESVPSPQQTCALCAFP
ncbi:hypothetical protein [Kocuria sp.]|uniref:hypothetical protein n=1 Tax=Kocuria sp. TaxID=1871328 RepID=UPI0026E014A6|nr:hypothetical protein [Kocuria sp.]MDO5617146.1 hypothetical protein [Kocuria sp.]